MSRRLRKDLLDAVILADYLDDGLDKICWSCPWWAIETITEYNLRRGCVVLAGLHDCSFCPTGRVRRQFGHFQSVPPSDCSYPIRPMSAGLLARLRDPELSHSLSVPTDFWCTDVSADYLPWLMHG